MSKIDELMSFIAPHTRGKIPGDIILRRTVGVVERLIRSSEQVLDDGIKYRTKT